MLGPDSLHDPLMAPPAAGFNNRRLTVPGSVLFRN
jgi:hypothetical protein